VIGESGLIRDPGWPDHCVRL